MSSLDYSRFKLFQLSVLWRAGASQHKFFAGVELGRHEEIIRRMIYDGDIGHPYKYGCIMVGLLTGSDKVQVVDGLIVNPEPIRLCGHRGYRFVFAGSAWFYVVSDHSASFPKREFFITDKGLLRLPFIRAENTELFVKLSQRLVEQGKA